MNKKIMCLLLAILMVMGTVTWLITLIASADEPDQNTPVVTAASSSDDEEIELKENTTADDIEDWDSLEHINLIVAVENSFDMKFTMGEVTTMKNVGAMVDIILERI